MYGALYVLTKTEVSRSTCLQQSVVAYYWLTTECCCMLPVRRPPGDAWGRVASLVNLLEKLEYQKTVLVTGPKEGK